MPDVYDSSRPEDYRRGHQAPAGQPGQVPNPAERAERERLDAAQRGSSGKDEGADKGAAGKADTLGKGFNAAESPNVAIARRFANTFLGNKTRRRNTLVGGVLGMVLGAFGIYTFFGVSGLEFIEVAKMLETHLSHNQDAGNDRVGKLFAYLRSGDIGDTRLNFLQRKLKNTMLEQLDNAGFKPNFGKLTTFEGFTIDTTNKASPYYKLNDAQIKAKLADNGITDNIATFAKADGQFTVTAKSGLLNGFFKKTILNKFLVAQMNESITPDITRVRILQKYGGVNWHPLQLLKSYVNTKANAAALAAWQKARDSFITSGEEPVPTIDTSKAGKKGPDGKVIPTPGENGPITSNKVSEILSSIKDSRGLSVAGGIASGVAILCIIYTIDQNYGLIHYAQYIAPAMRLAAEAIVVASQIQNGGDVSTSEMQSLAKQFNDLFGKSWAQAKTMQADAGEQGGIDLPQGTKDAFGETPPGWLSWIQKVPGIGQLCSTAGGIVVGVTSIVVGVISGETATTVIGGALSFLVLPGVINNASHLIAGDAINFLKIAGPLYGNVLNYGARFFANAQAIFDGGTVMSAAQEAQINSNQTSMEMQQFRSKNLAYRLFNPTDAHSLMAKVMATQTSSVVQNFRDLASSFLNIGHDFAAMPMNLISSTAFASPAVQYQYPFPMFAWSNQDLNNPLIQDPYNNADLVGTLLDNNNTNGEPDYIGMVATCFNDTITKSADGWDVIPGASSDSLSLNVYDAKKYNADNCNHPKGFNQQDWLRVRAFVFDTGEMEGYACEHGDNTSCTNDGWNE